MNGRTQKQHPLKKRMSKAGIFVASSQSINKNKFTSPQKLYHQRGSKLTNSQTIAERRGPLKSLSMERNRKKIEKAYNLNSEDKQDESGVRSELLDSITQLEKQYDLMQYKRSLFTNRNSLSKSKSKGKVNIKSQENLSKSTLKENRQNTLGTKSHFLLNKCVPKSRINLMSEYEDDAPPQERSLADVYVPEGEKGVKKTYSYSCLQSLQSSPYCTKQNLYGSNCGPTQNKNKNHKNSSLWDLEVISIGHTAYNQRMRREKANQSEIFSQQRRKGIRVISSNVDLNRLGSLQKGRGMNLGRKINQRSSLAYPI